MHTPIAMLHAVVGPRATAAGVLTAAHATLTAAVGVICLIAWYITHRHAAHRHPVAEVIAKVLLVVGGVILAVTVGITTGWITKLNQATANWLSAAAKDPTFSTHHLGALSFLAMVDVAFVAFTTWDLIQKSVKRRRAGGNAGAVAPGGAGRWGAAEHVANKYGWFGLGPLAVTLPGAMGVWVLTVLTGLATFVAHLVGSPFGLG